MNKYTMEELSDIFAQHAEEAERNRLRMVEQYKAMNPDEQVPKEMMDEFNLPMALHSMVEELRGLVRKEIQREDSELRELLSSCAVEKNDCNKDVK